MKIRIQYIKCRIKLGKICLKGNIEGDKMQIKHYSFNKKTREL